MAGHVQRRGKDSFLLVYNIGYDAKGRKKRKTKTVKAKNKTEAKKMLAEFIAEINRGEYVAPSKENFSSFVEVWRKDATRNLAPKTVEMYNYILDYRVLPAFSHLKLEDISHVMINDYIESIDKEGLSTSTQQKHLNLLSNIFKLAVKSELVRFNPVDKADKISVRYAKTDVYNDDELKEVLSLLNQEDNKQMALLVKLAFKTGMRKGEILALEWKDLDFSTNTIHIRHSLSYTKENGYQLKQPKTKNSVRNIGVSSNLMKELKKHVQIKRSNRMEAGELWEGGSYVFSTSLGNPIHQNVPSKWWSRFIDRMNRERSHPLKKIRFHDMRHQFATGLISKGGNINKISKYLGHSSISTSMDIYGHLLKEDREIADMIDDDYI